MKRLLALSLIFSFTVFSLSAQKIDISTIDQQDDWVDSVYNSLSPAERVGQLFMIEAYSNRKAEEKQRVLQLIQDYKVGGLVFFQGGPGRQIDLLNAYQEASKVPLLVAMDLEWGLGMRLDSTISFPYQMTLGALSDDHLIYEMGKELARQCKLVGVHVNFAPVVDVNNNAANPVINYRSFGENKFKVVEKGLNYMRGMQDHGIIATLKHFPGHGDTGTDSHYDLPVIKHDLARLQDIELYPFKSLIDKGAAGVMVAHMSVPAFDDTKNLPTTLSKPVIEGLLRKELGFNGVTFTDAMNMKGVTKYFKPGVADLKAISAGNDIIEYSENVKVGIDRIVEALESGEIDASLIEAKCKRMLWLKKQAGLNAYKPLSKNQIDQRLNTPEALALNQKLYEESLTLVKNNNQVIPLKAAGSIATISIGAKAGSNTVFQQTLSNFGIQSHFSVKAKASKAEMDAIMKALSGYETIILSLHQTSIRANNRTEYSKEVIAWMSSVFENVAPITVHFQNPYTMAKYPRIENSRAILVGYQNHEFAEKAAAELIVGKRFASGTLPVSIGKFFQSGDGIGNLDVIQFKHEKATKGAFDGAFLKKKVDSLATLAISQGATPGCEVLVAKDNKVIFHETYGFHTYDSTRAVSKDDLYDFASITKVSGPLPLLMKLVGEGQLSLEDNIGNYLPYFAGSPIGDQSIRSILSHNARLKAWIPYWTSTVKKNGKFKGRTFKTVASEKYPIEVGRNLYLHKNYKKKKMFKAIRKAPLNPEPGYLYSGLSFYLWPDMIESITGQDYETYLKASIYQPIGATSLTYNPLRFYERAKIVPTENDDFFRKQQLHGYVHDEGAAMMGGVSGNAGLFGTAADLGKLFQLYANYGQFAGESILDESVVKEFAKCQYCEQGNRRGLGFDKPNIEYVANGNTAEAAPATSFGHSGYTGPFAWADPDNNLVYIFLANRVYPTRENSKIYQLNLRPAIQEAIYESFN